MPGKQRASCEATAIRSERRHRPASDAQVRPGDEARPVGCEEHDGGDDFRPARVAEANVQAERSAGVGRAVDGRFGRGMDRRRCQSDADGGSPFEGQPRSRGEPELELHAKLDPNVVPLELVEPKGTASEGRISIPTPNLPRIRGCQPDLLSKPMMQGGSHSERLALQLV